MNENEMSDMIKNISSMLNGNDNIPDSIKDILKNYSNSSNENDIINDQSNNDSTNNTNQIDMDTILKISNIINTLNSSQNDDRSKLLLSLKPYLRKSKKEKLDQYIKLLNMSKVLNIFNNGSEFKK